MILHLLAIGCTRTTAAQAPEHNITHKGIPAALIQDHFNVITSEPLLQPTNIYSNLNEQAATEATEPDCYEYEVEYTGKNGRRGNERQARFCVGHL